MANPFAKSKLYHKIGNWMMAPVWSVAPVPRGLAFITTKGRKTGRTRKVAVRAVREGDRLYAVALLGKKASWLANARSNPDIRVKVGGKTYAARAREIIDPTERQRAREAYHPIAGWYDYYDYLTYGMDIPSRGRILRAHDRWFDESTPVAIDLRREAS